MGTVHLPESVNCSRLTRHARKALANRLLQSIVEEQKFNAVLTGKDPFICAHCERSLEGEAFCTVPSFHDEKPVCQECGHAEADARKIDAAQKLAELVVKLCGSEKFRKDGWTITAAQRTHLLTEAQDFLNAFSL